MLMWEKSTSKTDGNNVILFLLIMLMILSREEGLTVPPHRFTIILLEVSS